MPFGESPSEFALEDVQLYVGTLPDFLVMRVGENNQLGVEASLRVDEALFVETMMSVPLVAEVDAKVTAAKSLWQKQDMELTEKIVEVKKLLDEAVALFR